MHEEAPELPELPANLRAEDIVRELVAFEMELADLLDRRAIGTQCYGSVLKTFHATVNRPAR